jgi:hypothetical protein
MRIATLFCVLFLATACATPAAINAAAEELDPIAACAHRAAPDERSACIGVVSRPCHEAAGGETTGGSAACFARERALWEGLRDVVANTLRETETASQIALLDATLAEHERWTVARCAYAASIYEGGSLARVVGAQCMRDAIAEYTLDLMSRYDEP